MTVTKEQALEAVETLDSWDDGWGPDPRPKAFATLRQFIEQSQDSGHAPAPTDELQSCPECRNAYLAVRTDIYKDGREFVYCDVCGCLADHRVWNRIRALAAPAPTQQPRFFMDHGVWHDRETGKHLFYEGEGPEAETLSDAWAALAAVGYERDGVRTLGESIAKFAALSGAAPTPQPHPPHPLDALLPEICQLLDTCREDFKQRGLWTEWDQSVRERITAYNLSKRPSLRPVADPVVAWAKADMHGGEVADVTPDRNVAGGWRASGCDVRELVERHAGGAAPTPQPELTDERVDIIVESVRKYGARKYFQGFAEGEKRYVDSEKHGIEADCAMLPAIRSKLGAAPTQAPQQPVHVEGFLCRAWGESDLPAAALCTDLSGVRQFLIDEWLGDEGSPDADGEPILPGVMDELATYNWSDEGNTWQTEFEIGGLSVERVTFPLATPTEAVQGKENQQ